MPAARSAFPLQVNHATLAQALSAVGAQFGERPAYIGRCATLSFAAWVGQAQSLAAALSDQGVAVGDVLALMLPPSIDYALWCAAAVRLGAVVTRINLRLGPAEIEERSNDALRASRRSKLTRPRPHAR